jgi:hypothetical protein
MQILPYLLACDPLAERRQTPRLGFDCPVRWNNGGVDRFGQTLDISDHGLGFTTRPLCIPKRGDRIDLVLELDEQHDWPVDTAATVVRCDPLPQGLYVIGVQFSQPLEG